MIRFISHARPIDRLQILSAHTLLRIPVILCFLCMSLLSSCSYKEWHNEFYTFVGGSETRTLNSRTPIERRFYLANAEINFSVNARTVVPIEEHENSFFRSGPYEFVVSASGDIDPTANLIVRSVVLESSFGSANSYSLSPEFPLTARFQTPEFGIPAGVTYANIVFPNPLDLDWENGEEITLIIHISIEFSDVAVEEKVFELHFYPYLDAGGGYYPISN